MGEVSQQRSCTVWISTRWLITRWLYGILITTIIVVVLIIILVIDIHFVLYLMQGEIVILSVIALRKGTARG